MQILRQWAHHQPTISRQIRIDLLESHAKTQIPRFVRLHQFGVQYEDTHTMGFIIVVVPEFMIPPHTHTHGRPFYENDCVPSKPHCWAFFWLTLSLEIRAEDAADFVEPAAPVRNQDKFYNFIEWCRDVCRGSLGLLIRKNSQTDSWTKRSRTLNSMKRSMRSSSLINNTKNCDNFGNWSRNLRHISAVSFRYRSPQLHKFNKVVSQYMTNSQNVSQLTSGYNPGHPGSKILLRFKEQRRTVHISLSSKAVRTACTLEQVELPGMWGCN